MRLPTILLVLLLAAGCSQSGGGGAGQPVPADAPVADEPAPGAWARLPELPLAARQNPVTAYVGGEVVVVGGFTGPPCPPTASCAYQGQHIERDGASYDVAAGTWRGIADAPHPVPEWSPTAVIRDDLYVLTDRLLMAWDSGEDSWSQVPMPRGQRGSDLLADGTSLVLASYSDENGVRSDRVLDTATGEWTRLPEDPLKPSFDRSMVATPHGLVLTAKPIAADGGPEDPALVHAALLPPGSRTWQVLPSSDQLGGWRWSWTGRHLVDLSLGGADGGEVNNYGRVIPYGGRLDPRTGTWSRLPEAPDQGAGGWPVEAAEGPLVAAEGWLYDDARSADPGEAWTRLPRPVGSPGTPGPAVWAGGLLVVVGGLEWGSASQLKPRTPESVFSTGVWAYLRD